MVKGFNQSLFMEWLESEFNMNRFTIDIVLNILDYASKHEHVSKDQFCYFVADLIPEVDMLTVASFCDNSILTSETIKALNR